MKSKLLLAGLGAMLSLDVTAAESILVSSHGPFEKYNNCTIEDGHTTIKIINQFGHNLTEKSTIYHSTEEIKTLTTPAIAGIGRSFFRWFPTQTEYRARGATGSLVSYFKEGFENLLNDSDAAIELRSQTDFFCNELATDFRILGDFQVDLKIQDRIFADKMTFKRTNGPFYNAKVEGTYIVPDSFESKIKSLVYENGKFEFTIHVEEGDQKYDAVFEGSLNRKDQLEGKAFVLPERKLLGTFTGFRL